MSKLEVLLASRLIIALSFFLLLACTEDRQNQRILNGFRTHGKSLIELADILPGGPAKDEVPALFDPKFTTTNVVSWLSDSDLVIGVINGQIAKAYPIKILAWHQIVNDNIAGKQVVVSYCPLAAAALVFEADYETTYAVSGLIYQSNLLMYDQQTNSLFSQLLMKGVTGSRSGENLRLYPSQLVSYGDWKKLYPETLILSDQTGFDANYNLSPYKNYHQSDDLFFPIKNKNDQLAKKDKVFVVFFQKQIKAYPLNLFEGKSSFIDLLAGQEVKISVVGNQPTLAYAGSNRLKSLVTYWAPFYSLYPKTTIYD